MIPSRNDCPNEDAASKKNATVRQGCVPQRIPPGRKPQPKQDGLLSRKPFQSSPLPSLTRPLSFPLRSKRTSLNTTKSPAAEHAAKRILQTTISYRLVAEILEPPRMV